MDTMSVANSDKQDAESQGWLIHYWPVAGRAEFVRLVLVEAGQEFTECSDPEKIFRDFKCQKKDGWPVFAVPMISRGDFELGQTSTICRYLAQKFDLAPKFDTPDYWHADQICATVMDFITEGRLAFHGKNFYETYFNQVEETQPYIRYFEDNRLPKFLNHFEQLLRHNAANCSDGNKFLIGQKLTYCDLCLLHVLRAAEFQFADAWRRCINACPLLVNFKEQLECRPKLAEYLASDRCKPFEGNSMM